MWNDISSMAARPTGAATGRPPGRRSNRRAGRQPEYGFLHAVANPGSSWRYTVSTEQQQLHGIDGAGEDAAMLLLPGGAAERPREDGRKHQPRRLLCAPAEAGGTRRGGGMKGAGGVKGAGRIEGGGSV